EPASPMDQILDQHAPGRQHVRNASLARCTGCSPGRPEKNRMKMYCIEFANFALQGTTQCRCPIKSSERRTQKISNLNAFQIDGKSDWHRTVSRPINVRSKDMNFVPSHRQRLAEAVSRKDGPSIAHSRQVARDDVEDPHKSSSGRTRVRAGKQRHESRSIVAAT